MPKCSYFMCSNTHEQKSLFRFPTGDPRRLEIWLTNCGNMTIMHLSPEELRSRYLCSAHFDAKFLQNESGQRKRLSKLAVPLHYQDNECSVRPHSPIPSTSKETSPPLKLLTPKKVYSRPIDGQIQREMEEPAETRVEFGTPKKRKRMSEEDTPKCKRLKMSIIKSNKLLKQQKNKYTRLKKKMAQDKIVNLETHKFKGDVAKVFTCMQFKNKKRQWTEAEKKFCLSLYYQSPATYKNLLKGGITLAAPTTIQSWLQATDCLAGLNEEVFNNIQIKFADQSIKEKACVICFDEMSIKTDLEFTKKYDLIEGFEDFGGGERSPKEAKYALVFVARGIYNNWKIPLAYFLSHQNVKAEKLIMIIKSVINKMFMCGLLPKVIVCDQATTNQKAIKSLGATKDDPYFFIENHKIFSIFDVPHLIKNIRNNLLDNNYDLNGNEISFNDIITVYNIDKNNKSKSLRKLTPVHLKPNSFQKMKVKLATQIFSNSVGAAIETAIASGELKSDTAKTTADFVKNMNDLFDSLNSRNKFDKNPFKCAITKNKTSCVHQSLNKGNEMFNQLKKITINKKNERKLTIPPCFEGMQQSINAVLQLSTEEFSQGTEVKFLMTYRLNQDVIENLFGIYRMRGGCNRNPTSKNLRSMFRSNLLNNLIKLENTNCETDDDTFLSTSAKDQQQNTQLATSQLTPTHPIAGPSSAVTLPLHPSPSFNPPFTSPEEPTITPKDANLETCSVAGPSSAVTLPLHPSPPVNPPNTSPDEPSTTPQEITLETCSVVYFAGWLGKVCAEKFDCSICKCVLINDEVDLVDKKQLLLINKTYSNLSTPSLKSPTDFLYNLVNHMLDLFNNSINVIHKTDLLSNLKKSLLNIINLPNDYHDFSHIDFLITKLLEVKIHDYCKTKKKSFEGRSKLRILQHK